MVIKTSNSKYMYNDPIQLVLIQCLHKDPNQRSHLYKDHINLYIYQNQMPYRNFTSIVISFSSPNDKKILE